MQVETASPRPDASCTGATAAEEGKRGATATTPSPTVFDADATRAPQSSAVCKSAIHAYDPSVLGAINALCVCVFGLAVGVVEVVFYS